MRSFHIRPTVPDSALVASLVRSIACGNPATKVTVEANVDDNGHLHPVVRRVDSFCGHEEVVCLAVAWLAEHDAWITEQLEQLP